METRAQQFYAGRATWHGGRRTWTWRDGATLKMRYLERDEHAGHYQGHSYSWLGFDELGEFPSPVPVDKLRATLRSEHGVPCVFRGSGNPGGRGHNWLKARYIDPSPPYHAFLHHEDAEGERITIKRLFISALLTDNILLQQSDPNYWMRVASAVSGNAGLLKAWRFGLWDIVAGGMFDDVWNPQVHVLEPFTIPATWYVDRAHDWGSSAPFATLWFAESNGETVPETGKTYPKGAVFIIAEDYGWNGKPNGGLRLTNAAIAERVTAKECVLRQRGQFKIHPGPADTQIYTVMNGTSIADDMAGAGVVWLPAQKGPGAGWQDGKRFGIC